MSKFSPPNALSFEGNIAENWTKFKKEFHFYMTATESNNKPEDVKTSRLLTCIGEKQKEIHNRKAKDLPVIPTGSTVRIHDGKTWHEKHW